MVKKSTGAIMHHPSDFSFHGKELGIREAKQTLSCPRKTVSEKQIKVIQSLNKKSHQDLSSARRLNTGLKNEARARPEVQAFMPTYTKPSSVLSEESAREQNRTRHPQFVSVEAASNTSQRDQPRLVSIRRLDQEETNKMESRLGHDDVFVKYPVRAGFSGTNADTSTAESFTYIVEGGVIQKIPFNKSWDNTNSEPSVRMRTKLSTSKTKPDRRVSCKDLGHGDCEGWLYKKMEKGRTQWNKRWCVLKNYNFYYYRNKSDLQAEGAIHLPAFQVSPPTDLNKKKFVFKIYNSGTTFSFAAERQDDMCKWMNKISLATIIYDASKDVTTSGFSKPQKSSVSSSGAEDGYSESEDEGTDMTREISGSVQSLTSLSCCDSMTSPQLSPVFRFHKKKECEADIGASTKTFHSIMRCIEEQNLTIDGKDKMKQRRSRCTVTQELLEVANKAELDKLKKLQSLQRTLQAKLLELGEIEVLLTMPISRFELYNFAITHNLEPEMRQTYL